MINIQYTLKNSSAIIRQINLNKSPFKGWPGKMNVNGKWEFNQSKKYI